MRVVDPNRKSEFIPPTPPTPTPHNPPSTTHTIQAKPPFIQPTLSHPIRPNPIKKTSSFLVLLRSEG